MHVHLKLMYISVKYPLSIVNHLLDVLPGVLAGGYDVGCKFESTIRNSTLGPTATTRYHSLIGVFHGHAHARSCQLRKLGTYIEGQGLANLEDCERFFSKSNALATTVRSASVFHRRQAIGDYCYHTDNYETFGNLAKYLCDNYKQALDLIHSGTTLKAMMDDLKVTRVEEFSEWLEEEKEYLSQLKKAEPPEREALEMEYVIALDKFDTIG